MTVAIACIQMNWAEVVLVAVMVKQTKHVIDTDIQLMTFDEHAFAMRAVYSYSNCILAMELVGVDENWSKIQWALVGELIQFHC